MMHGRNNYACIDVVILYRLCLATGYMYAYRKPVQRVDNFERTMMMCIYKVSYRIGLFILFIDNDYKSATKLHISNEIFLRRW